MARETQLDTHEIDKLLADDDFIDDFNFDEEEDIDFVIDQEDESEPEAEPEPPAVEPAPELKSETPAPESPSEAVSSAGNGSPAGLVVAENIMAEVADEFDGLDLTGLVGRVPRPRGIKLLALIALFALFIQLVLVVILLRRPVLIRTVSQVLTAEIDLAAAPAPVPAAEVLAGAQIPVPDEPQVLMFQLFAPLYSLKGLKVVSLEIEVIQFPPHMQLGPVEQENLKVILGRRLRGLLAGEMREKIKDLTTLLEGPLREEIEGFFAARELEPAKLEIRFPAIHVQE